MLLLIRLLSKLFSREHASRCIRGMMQWLLFIHALLQSPPGLYLFCRQWVVAAVAQLICISPFCHNANISAFFMRDDSSVSNNAMKVLSRLAHANQAICFGHTSLITAGKDSNSFRSAGGFTAISNIFSSSSRFLTRGSATSQKSESRVSKIMAGRPKPLHLLT